MVEIEFSILSRQCLDRQIPSVEILKSEVACWEKQRNEQKATVRWHFTTDVVRQHLRVQEKYSLRFQLFGAVNGQELYARTALARTTLLIG